MRGIKINPYQAQSYPLPLGFNGRRAGLYRWFSGRPLNGHRYTDATGFRYGTQSLDPSGHASSFQLLPGYLRFAYARLPLMLLVPFALSWLLWPRASYLTTLALVLVATWRVQRWRARRAFRRSVLEPVSAAAARVLQSRHVAGQGHTWVNVPPDFRDSVDAKINVRLPMDWVGQDGEKAALVRAVSGKLGLDDLVASWTLAGHQPSVTLSLPPAPPVSVSFADALADAGRVLDTEVMLGYGVRGKVETFSLTMESPHALFNGGSGAGKSVLLAWIIGQFKRRGAGVAVLDAKFVSHMWLRRVPGVLYASEDSEIHDALVWLDAELLRRARFVSKASDVDKAAASLPVLLVVLEEITTAAGRLRSYWKSIKGPEDPALSPALTALASLANMGREMRVHVLMAGQSITAKVTGGPEGRESFGGRLLARATSNAWRMLAPQIKPAPVKRGRPGRWHIVVGDSIREFQAPFVDLKNETDPEAVAKLIEWATGGLDGPDVVALMAGGGGTQIPETPTSEVVPPNDASLKDYATARGMDLPWLRRQIERRPEAPEPTRVTAGNTRRYSWGALDGFVAGRLREPADAPD